ncbi:extracellular solute-binding protein [Glycomyces sp. NPDC047369]
MKPSTESGLSRRSFGRLAAGTAAALPAAAALAACAEESDPNTVTFLSWDGAVTMDPVIAEFKKQYPDYKVEATYPGGGAPYIQKLQTQLGSDSAPDVFIITAENKKQLIDAALVQDLGGEPWAANLADAAIATYSRDGKLYGSAVSAWGGGLAVNNAVLDPLGEFPADWDSFLDLCGRIRDTGVRAIMEAVDSITATLAALLGQQNVAYGGTMDQQIFDGDLTFEEAWTPAVAAWYRLFEEGHLDNAAAGTTYDQVIQEFQQGRTAMISAGSWGLPGIVEGAPDLDLTFKAAPGIAGVPYWCGAVSPGLALNAKAKQPEAAKKFIDWMSTKAGVEVYQEVNQNITTTKDFEPELPAEFDELVPAVRAGEYYLPSASWPDFSDALATESTALVQQLASGQIGPEDVGKGMDAKLDSLR